MSIINAIPAIAGHDVSAEYEADSAAAADYDNGAENDIESE